MEPIDSPGGEERCASGDDKQASKVSRKVGEKVRRDRLNSLILQLAEEVPTVQYAQRRLDKSTILRLTVSYLKLHHGLKKKKLQQCFTHLSGSVLDSVKKVTTGAVMVVTQSHTILYVSNHITDYLGYCQTDMIGHNLDQFVHPEDLGLVAAQFTGETELPSNTAFGMFEDRVGTGINPFNVDIVGTEQVSFFIRMKKHTKKRNIYSDQQPVYELMHILAHCEQEKTPAQNSGDRWMMATVRPFCKKPVREIPLTMSEFIKNNEWASMHALDSTTISIEQRASLYHGFLVSDQLGQQPHLFIYPEDLKYVARSHRLIMKHLEVSGTIFRMKTIYDCFLFIRSHSIIIHDRWTKEPKCIVSVNTVLTDEDGMKLMRAQREQLDRLEKLSLCDSDSDTENKSSCSASDAADSGMFSDTTSCGNNTPPRGIDTSPRSDMSYDAKSDISLEAGFEVREPEDDIDVYAFYMNRAKEYPELLQSPNNSSSSSSLDSCSISYGTKRSVDCVDEENHDSELKNTDCRRSCSSRKQRLGEVPLQSQRLVEDRLHKLEDYSFHGDDDDAISGCTCSPSSESTHDSTASTSLPILKGILEGRLKLGQGQYSEVEGCLGRSQGSGSWQDGHVHIEPGGSCQDEGVQLNPSGNPYSEQSIDSCDGHLDNVQMDVLFPGHANQTESFPGHINQTKLFPGHTNQTELFLKTPPSVCDLSQHRSDPSLTLPCQI